MGNALYREYRPKKLSEIVGQEHITDTLAKALKKGSISHAYLFTGPKGVGKTSIARILAHEVNGLTYADDATHLDIIEIDAASNRRIDEIRDLRDKVHSAPTSGKYKVYIIDEVHMLTKEAFNALLKTLEEPPSHVIFILATTEAHKLPETIISRTQRYTFKPIEPIKVINHLAVIAKKEGITVSQEALELIAAHGEGSFRDSISLLDQISSSGEKIEIDDVLSMLGIAPEAAIADLITALDSADVSDLILRLKALYSQGFQATRIAKQISVRLRADLLVTNAQAQLQLTKLLRRLIDIASSSDPETLLELTLIEYSLHNFEPLLLEVTPAKHIVKEAGITPLVVVEETKISRPTTVQKKAITPSIEPVQPTPRAETSPSQPNSDASAPFDMKSWELILAATKQRHNTIYSLVRMAQPQFNGNEITLGFSFPFHQKRLSEAKNKQLIIDTVLQVTGVNATINCIVEKVIINTPKDPIAESDVAAPFEAISNIFGGIEVLES